MNEADWDECEENDTATTVTPDPQRAISLRKTTDGRRRFLDTRSVTGENANYLFEGYYTTVLEHLHSRLAEKGLKVRNHLCLAHYLRDVENKPRLARTFDDCRQKRNKLQYYGKAMEPAVAEQAIAACKTLLEALGPGREQ